MSIRGNATTDKARRTANLSASNAFSMTLWVSSTAANNSTFRNVFSLNDGVSHEYQLGIDNTNKWSMARGTTSVDMSAGEGTVVVEQWNCFTIQAGAANIVLRRFRPGSTSSTDFQLTSSSNAVDSFTATEMVCFQSVFTNGCDCQIAHLRVWDAELTLDEILREIKSPWPVRTTNLNTAFTGRELSSGDIVDISGNSRNWTGTSLGTDGNMPPFPNRSNLSTKVISFTPFVPAMNEAPLWVNRGNIRLR